MRRVTETPHIAAARLPVHAHAADIIAAVRDHQVVVIEGPTGSGKTTQVPQIIFDAGITDRVIGVTQPRRIAAVSVAWRIAAERGVEVGGEVGYAIRFDDRCSAATRIKIMTDGILLQQARTDHDFDQYGVIIIDEAHERTLNIDFILGLLHRALRGRADLRVIVSSATLQPLIFQRFFSDAVPAVPVVSIDARPYDVDIQYRPMRGGDLDEVVEAVTSAIERYHRRGKPGDVLAFLSGQAGIERTATNLARRGATRGCVVIPLFGALTRQEQERVFDDVGGQRKIVLATNVAETSVTVPGVRCVIDSGRVKVMRINARTGVRTLREEFVSRASADQRAGRAGRTAPGVCLRLYSEDDYLDQPRFGDEEVLRLDLREVVLRLADLGIRDVENFKLPTRPPRGRIRAAVDQLRRTGAIDADGALTSIGRRMVVFPLAPDLARMVVFAADEHPEALDDVLLLAAGLGGRRPWQFSPDQEAAARAAHRRFDHPLGDAMALLNLARQFAAAKDRPRFCERNHVDLDVLAYTMRAHEQLRDFAREIGMDPQPTDARDRGEGVVRSLAMGFANNMLVARGRQYETFDGLRVGIHPASTLWGTAHRFLVSADLIVLRRPYAAQVSAVRAEWLAHMHPDAARKWHVRVRDKGLHSRRKLTDSDVPASIDIGGLSLAVTTHKGRAVVQIPKEHVGKLAAMPLSAIDDEQRRLRSCVAIGGYRFSQGVQLRVQLRLLAIMPLPDGEEVSAPSAPIGAILEHDRNLHTIGRHLPQLLEPCAAPRGKTAGWLALVANGVGTYWFEVIPGLRDALTTTVLSVEDLDGRLPVGDELAGTVRETLEKLVPMADKVTAAYGKEQGGRRRKR